LLVVKSLLEGAQQLQRPASSSSLTPPEKKCAGY